MKATHPHLSSVVEIGAVVGSMWRDLDPAEKQNYVDQFTREKVISVGCLLSLKLNIRQTIYHPEYFAISQVL